MDGDVPLLVALSLLSALAAIGFNGYLTACLTSRSPEYEVKLLDDPQSYGLILAGFDRSLLKHPSSANAKLMVEDSQIEWIKKVVSPATKTTKGMPVIHVDSTSTSGSTE